jgi:hypothetical protein
MGYQTLVMINNDYIHQAKDYPSLGTELHQAVSSTIVHGRVPFGRGIGEAWLTSHADQCSLLVCGNLELKELTAVYSRSDNPEKLETQLTLLKLAARKLGYQLHRISSSK